MNDFPPPSTPTPTYPAPRTAPFPSLHPQTESVSPGNKCHLPRREEEEQGGKTLIVCLWGPG